MRKNIFKLFFALISVALITVSCNRGKNTNTPEELADGVHAVTIIEVIQTSNYTYLQVLEGQGQYWIAVNAREIQPGDPLYFSEVLEMTDFVSKELNRTFPVIYFVQDPSDNPIQKQEPVSMGKPQTQQMQGIEIEHIEAGLTVAEIYSQKDNLQGKSVKIRGVVVKTNKNIMGKNWMHLQDGTGENGNFDLTVTSLDLVEVGTIATFEGVIEINKDFGAGYVYDIIMENAVISDIKEDPKVL